MRCVQSPVAVQVAKIFAVQVVKTVAVKVRFGWEPCRGGGSETRIGLPPSLPPSLSSSPDAVIIARVCARACEARISIRKYIMRL